MSRLRLGMTSFFTCRSHTLFDAKLFTGFNWQLNPGSETWAVVCGSPNAEKHAGAVKAWVGEHNVLRVYYGRYHCCKAADTTTFLP